MNEISGFRIVYQEFCVSPDPRGVVGEKMRLSANLGLILSFNLGVELSVTEIVTEIKYIILACS
jgi:hypothetical protein